MTILDLVRKLIGDLRSGNGEALDTILALFAAIVGRVLPTGLLPRHPNPEVGTMHSLSSAQSNQYADELESLLKEADRSPGAKKFGDGVLLGKLIALLMKMLGPYLGLPPLV